LFAVYFYRRIDGDELIIETLLESGYQADGFTLRASLYQCFPAVSSYRQLPFHVFEKLVQSCNDVDADCSKNVLTDHTGSPLHLAVSNDDLKSARLLIKHGANVDVYRERLYSCLALSAAIGNLPMACLLLDHGANPNGLSWSLPTIVEYDPTPLQAAAAEGYVGLAHYLLSRDADINERKRQLWSSDMPSTALQAAAYYGLLDMVQLLLSSGASIRDHGSVQYVRAIQLANTKGHGAVADLLRSQRRRSADDQAIAEKYSSFYCYTKVFLEPKEFSLAELVDALVRTEDELLDARYWTGRLRTLDLLCMWEKGASIAVSRWADNLSTDNLYTKDDIVCFATRVATKSIQMHASTNKFAGKQVGVVVSHALEQWTPRLRTGDGCLDIHAVETIQDSTVQGLA
jgi:ankyrin repeat protein